MEASGILQFPFVISTFLHTAHGLPVTFSTLVAPLTLYVPDVHKRIGNGPGYEEGPKVEPPTPPKHAWLTLWVSSVFV